MLQQVLQGHASPALIDSTRRRKQITQTIDDLVVKAELAFLAQFYDRHGGDTLAARIVSGMAPEAYITNERPAENWFMRMFPLTGK